MESQRCGGREDVCSEAGRWELMAEKKELSDASPGQFETMQTEGASGSGLCMFV